MCSLFADVILLFTVPKIYVTYQAQIDQAIETFLGRVNEVMAQ